MTKQEQEVLEIVKLRLQLEDDKLDALISSYIKEIGRRILHYCNIRSIPDALIYVWASMVMDAVRVELSAIDEIADSTDSGVSIKIGDTSSGSAGGSSGGGVSSTSKSVIDEVVLNYRVDLNHYRRLKW